MRRADRLFQIIQILRVQRTVTAAYLASELEASHRLEFEGAREYVE